MKLIPLSQNRFAQVDDEDYLKLIKYKWHYNGGYAKTWYKGKRIRMHRLILNASANAKVDHIDHDKLNNQKSNLRLCTTTQNNQNGVLRKDNTSGYKGVSLERSTGHWRPLVYANGKVHYIGQFKDKHHAALARDLWAIDLHGEFAATNFPVISTVIRGSA